MTHGMDQFNIDGYHYTLKYLQIDAHTQAIMYTYSSLYFPLREPNSNDIKTLIRILKAQMLVSVCSSINRIGVFRKNGLLKDWGKKYTRRVCSILYSPEVQNVS